MAVSGMSPSADVDGRFRSPDSFCAQAVAMEIWNSRRHRPSWMTTGILSVLLALTGTPLSVNVPSKFVVVETSGSPVTSAPHDWHCTIGWFGSESNAEMPFCGM